MAKAKSKLQKAKEIASKVKKPNRKKSSVERYSKQGQSHPQSKAWTEPNDEMISAKPIGWRFTTEGAKRLKISNAKAKPSKEQIEKYSGKTFTKSGEEHRYIYQESRVDKSDKSAKAKFKDGGATKQSSPQSQSYKRSADKKVPAKPVGWRYKGNNYNQPSESVIKREMKKDREDRKIYFEKRKDKSDFDFYDKLKKGGQTSPQSESYKRSNDKKVPAKPVGWRFKGNNYNTPTDAQRKRDLKKDPEDRRIYFENRKDKSDYDFYDKLEDGGMMKKGGSVQDAISYLRSENIDVEKSIKKGFDWIVFYSTDEMPDNFDDLSEREQQEYGTHFTNKGIIDFAKEIGMADGGMMKSGGATFSGRQYNPYNKALDGDKTAKPVGYRFTNELANRLNKRKYAKPTRAEVEKYLGRGVYWEGRQDKSDLKPTTSKTYASFGYGGETYARGGVERISNAESRTYTENMIPFKANNLEGKTLSNGDYVVLSYGYYPIWWYCKAEGKWYGNSTKYSVSTSKHMSQSRPTYDATMISRDELDKKMMSHSAKYEDGGALNLLADTSGASLQSVGGTAFSNADLTAHLDMNANPNF